MALSSEDLIWVRTKIGDKDPPSDADLDARYDVLQDRTAVVREVLDKRLANFAADPAQFVVPGDYSQNVTGNLDELRQAAGAVGGASAVMTQIEPDRRYSR